MYTNKPKKFNELTVNEICCTWDYGLALPERLTIIQWFHFPCCPQGVILCKTYYFRMKPPTTVSRPLSTPRSLEIERTTRSLTTKVCLLNQTTSAIETLCDACVPAHLDNTEHSRATSIHARAGHLRTFPSLPSIFSDHSCTGGSFLKAPSNTCSLGKLLKENLDLGVFGTDDYYYFFSARCLVSGSLSLKCNVFLISKIKAFCSVA